MRRAFLLLPVLLAFVPWSPAVAQSEGDVAAYLALTVTPTGAFAPVARAAWLEEAGGNALSLRYGRLSYEADETIHNLGISGDFGAGRARVGLTAGAVTCSACDAVLMFGADVTTPLVRRVSSDATFGVGFAAAAGAGIPTAEGADGVALSGSLGLPLILIAGAPNGLRAIPYITPAVGFGTLTGEGGASGVRPMLAGGIGVVAANGIGVSAGVQKVFIDGGEAVLGLSLTFGRR
jgi:hypothetical protein